MTRLKVSPARIHEKEVEGGLQGANRILFCATVDYHFKAFHLPYMRWFKEHGWEVHVAASGKIELPFCDRKYNLPIRRSPLKWNNFKAYKQLKKLIEQSQYNIIHAHTPMGGVLVRLAARNVRKEGTRIFYTAHGFHFYRGASLLNWLIYYPLERWLAHYTDCLITINSEDYNFAVKHHFNAGSIEHVHGVGVDTEKFKPADRETRNRLRKEHGYGEGEFLLYYAGELNKNKNQGLLIKAVSEVKKNIPGVRLLLAGEGKLRDYYMSMARKLGIEDKVDFLGFRKDVDEIARMSDVAVSGSSREGLPVNIMEALACGKPVVAADNRGHRELIENGKNGFVTKGDEFTFAQKLYELYKSSVLQSQFSYNSVIKMKTYSLSNVMKEMEAAYHV